MNIINLDVLGLCRNQLYCYAIHWCGVLEACSFNFTWYIQSQHDLQKLVGILVTVLLLVSVSKHVLSSTEKYVVSKFHTEVFKIKMRQQTLLNLCTWHCY